MHNNASKNVLSDSASNNKSASTGAASKINTLPKKQGLYDPAPVEALLLLEH